MNYDITFCSNLNCKQDCKRNQNNIEDKSRLVSISNFTSCEYFK